jgi:preprotein translocase subunit SecA
MSLLDRALRVGESKKFKIFEKSVGRINDYEAELELESEDELRERYSALRQRCLNGEELESLLFESFALTREASKRALGQRHYDVQLIGGMVLHDGSIAEMKTGEGKTLTATLPIVLNGLEARDENGHPVHGKGVHLVTVNDYLARRDANWMKPIYDLLGVTVGTIQSGMNDIDKQEAYSRDVVYGTNSEFGFDYLRDNLADTATPSSTRSTTFSSTKRALR